MKTRSLLATILLLSLPLLSGCKGDRIISATAERAYASAPEGVENAVDSYFSVSTTGGSWVARAEGMYRDGEWLRAERLVVKGVFITVERAPFAWRIEQ